MYSNVENWACSSAGMLFPEIPAYCGGNCRSLNKVRYVMNVNQWELENLQDLVESKSCIPIAWLDNSPGTLGSELPYTLAFCKQEDCRQFEATLKIKILFNIGAMS